MTGHYRARFAASARIPDFSAKDLYFPEIERTRSILSAFINFVKFAEQCQPFVFGLREKSLKAIEERDAVASELAQLKSKLKAAKEQMAKDEPRCDELRKENNSITAHLRATKEIQTGLVTDIEGLKTEKAALIQRKAGPCRVFALLNCILTIMPGIFELRNCHGNRLNNSYPLSDSTISGAYKAHYSHDGHDRNRGQTDRRGSRSKSKGPASQDHHVVQH